MSIATYQQATEQAETGLNITSARSLMGIEFPPLVYAVDRFICEGLTFVVAASKIGKSWLMLLMAYCVANGVLFLGRKTNKCRVLYFALEDSERRIQSRLNTMGISDVPENLYIATKAKTFDAGFNFQLDTWLKLDTTPAMVIIDTFQKVRGVAKGNTNAYQSDYEVVGGLKAIADKYHAMIVCVHHTNKSKFATDPFDKVSGSNGIMGAADTTILIDRERGEDTATVRYEGRDAWGDDFIIRFDNGVWGLESDNAAEFKAQRDYDAEPIVQLFRKLITESPNGGRWTYNRLQAIGLEFLGYQPFIDGKDCAAKLSNGLADEIRKRDNVVIECGVRVENGKGIKLLQAGPVTTFQTRFTEPEELIQ